MKRSVLNLGCALAGFIALVGMSSCGQKPVSSVPEGMTLVWSDEFDTDGAPDSEKWDYSIGGNGWGNGEAQKYTNTRENSIVKKGNLVITALYDGLWSSARLKTQFKARWTYGYFEIRAKLPRGVGTWPAIWMLPEFDKYGMWPRSGEIDIMEHVGFDEDVVHTTAHTKAFNHRINTQKTHSEMLQGAARSFHVYGLEWNPEYLQWYIDGKPFYRFDNTGGGIDEWPFDIPYYLIINLAIGGSWGGQQGIDPNMKKAEFLIDYVRVYQAP